MVRKEVFVLGLGLIFSASAFAYARGNTQPAPWDYSTTYGPKAWASLSDAYQTCGNGHMQSPIDIPATTVDSKHKLITHYQDAPIKQRNNGHTVQQSFTQSDAPQTIEFDGKLYQLQQIHFHAPSEHRVHGKSYPMEMHLVHQNEFGELLVIGVLIKQGHANPYLQNVLTAPEKENAKQPQDLINPAWLLPAKRSFYSYLGSLTTPPCSEGVKWVLMTEPMTASKRELASLKAVIHHSNNRPIQALNHRRVGNNKS